MIPGYDLILPLVLHLLIFCQGIGESFTSRIEGAQYRNHPQVRWAQQRETMEYSRKWGASSTEARHMRNYRAMEGQMRQGTRQAQRIRF